VPPLPAALGSRNLPNSGTESLRITQIRTAESITVASSPFAPRKTATFAERKATLIPAPLLSDTRFESWRPPPFDRVPQPVSIQSGPVSTNWRALLIWCTYCRISEGWRDSRPRNRGTHPPAQQAPKVSNWPESLEIA